jgi:hypothetical protein
MAEKIVAPSPKEVDALIVKYAEAQKTAAETKVKLTDLVEQWGRQHTDKSKRLDGLNGSTATTTTATPSVEVPAAIERLLGHLKKTPKLMRQFFRRQVTYSLVPAPARVLLDLKADDETRETLTPMVALCFTQKKNAPSLKVECAAVETKAA